MNSTNNNFTTAQKKKQMKWEPFTKGCMCTIVLKTQTHYVAGVAGR